MKRARSPDLCDPAEQHQAVYPRGLELPDGWLDCPAFGTNIKEVKIVPAKAPLSSKFDRVIPPAKRFRPYDVVSELQSMGVQIGLVVDLTNTRRYYDSKDWEELGVQHLKIHCRGRGQAPEPEAVNLFCWEVANFHRDSSKAGGHVLVHCTHGFNRTGYMIANYLVRMGYPLPSAVKLFAVHRFPGIYKDDYLEALFKYTHFKRGNDIVTPPVPAWKGREGSPELEGDDDGLHNGTADQDQPEIQHDDQLGEGVCPEEAEMVQRSIMTTMLRQGKGDADGEGVREWEGGLYFPGSQPVSLARSNLELLHQRRYWVTWKADGTRYMLLICTWGSYLIDRSFNVRRVQMRFPKPTTPLRPDQPPRAGGPHHFTLLDGEMVVDEDVVADSRERRYLAYDLVMLNGKSLMDQPFKARFSMIGQEVVQPRAKEKQSMASSKARFVYLYDEEPFRVRQKDFWPLSQADKVLHKFIPALSHESDGLILQGWEEPYITGTCKELLKWKFANMNSVDFMLEISPEGKLELLLLETRGGQKKLRPLDGSKVDLAGADPESLCGKIIECSFDQESQTWVFMRERKDKDMPNAFHVFEKVLRSIRDNITQEFLLDYLGEAMQESVYDKDRALLAK